MTHGRLVLSNSVHILTAVESPRINETFVLKSQNNKIYNIIKIIINIEQYFFLLLSQNGKKMGRGGE